MTGRRIRPLGFGETFGEVVQGPLAGVTLSAHASDSCIPPHEHASGYICAVLSGGFIERGRAESQHCRERTVIVHPPGERHSDVFGPRGALCLNVHLAAPPGEPLLQHWDANLSLAIQELALETAKGPRGDGLTAEAAVAEIAQGIWSAGQLAGDANCASPVLEALDDCPESPWTLGTLARIAGRHPAHLARAFRARTGMSIGKYRQRRRLIRLCTDLRTTTRGLAELASVHGYADQAHMTREFTRVIGIGPGTFRRLTR